jgi:hypothetical protein
LDVERAGGLECLQDGDGGGEAFSARAGHEQVSGGLVVVDDPDLDWGGGGFDEVASMTAVRTTEREGHLTMLLYLYDETAVSAQLILNTLAATRRRAVRRPREHSDPLAAQPAGNP